jgi:hypothetical protein
MKRYLIIALLLSSALAFGAGGTCPSSASYINPANPNGSLVTLSSLGITSCYYASKSLGADTNTGTDEAHPWAHLPEMPSCTNNCAALSHGSPTSAAGTGFILRGGDIWVGTDLGMQWLLYGTSSHPVYTGIDPGWPSSGWTRPVFTCGAAPCSSTLGSNGFWTDGTGSPMGYNIVDDIEFTGLYQYCTDTSSAPNCNSTSVGAAYVRSYGNNNIFTRNYAHSWSHASTSGLWDNESAFTSSSCCGGNGLASAWFNIVDGSDTSKDMLNAYSGDWKEVGWGVINYVTNGAEGSQTIVHDMWIGNVVVCFAGACHQNAIQQTGPASGTLGLFYNIVITGVTSGGATKLWLNQNSSIGSSGVTYAFNNVLFNNVAGNDVDNCQEGTNCGTTYYFNNTFQCGNSSSVGSCQSGSSGAIQHAIWINNQCIATSCVSASYSGYTYSETTDLVQSVATASGQGYTYNSTYAFQPTSGSGGTVGAGTNETALCTTISGLNAAAGTACQNATGYAGVYNTTNHTVTFPALALNTRPASTAWDIGAYEYASGGGTTYHCAVCDMSELGYPEFMPVPRSGRGSTF